jgi:acyl-[acyl-carrier-protein]-phospholipid O-acyltransferase/long-chain-fatty-acid--[acyl-carrier-protein] ligase
VRIRFNIFSETAAILVRAARQPYLFKSMLTNSWFWFVCMTFLTQCPAFTREVIGANEDVVTMFLTSFSVGIGIGAVVCGALLKGKVSTRWVPWSGLMMSLFIFDLYWTSAHVLPVHHGPLLAIDVFLAGAGGWRMVMDLFMLSFAGGFYIVPLYAIIQQQSEAQYRAQMMACNNVINAFFMVASALMALGLFALRFSVAEVFLTAGVLNTLVAVWLFTPHGRLHAQVLPVNLLPY